MRYTQETMEERLEKELNSEYKHLGIFVNMKTKTKFLHVKCNNIFEMTPHNLLNNKHRCTQCNGKKQRNYLQLKEEIFQKYNGEYTLVSSEEELRSTSRKSSMLNTNKKVKLLHNKCGKQFEIRLSNFLNQGQKCSHCKTNKKLSNEEFQKILDKNYGKGYFKLVGDYNGGRKHVEVLHLECNHITKSLATNFKVNNQGCSYCKSSISEQIIQQFCLNNNLKFIKNKAFDNLKFKQKLLFDFKIKNFLIEYDGKQHFEQVRNWDLELIKTRDKMKDEYCLNNNLTLIRIAYTNKKKLTDILNDIFIDSTTISNLLNKYALLIIHKGKIYKSGIYKEIDEMEN